MFSPIVILMLMQMIAICFAVELLPFMYPGFVVGLS